MKKIVLSCLTSILLLSVIGLKTTAFADEPETNPSSVTLVNEPETDSNSITLYGAPSYVYVSNYTLRTSAYPPSTTYVNNYNYMGALYYGTLTRTKVVYEPDAKLYFATYAGTLNRYR
ncbi:hypothetical protein [Vagococcus acidifermentans]|uniref:hypothetical protein n=1 Tax=Vagococcus acidifermentans TaxID=564710 RepID=UPI000F87AC8F|nr:hypothetical protein [Vagococcus acidifermentans]